MGVEAFVSEPPVEALDKAIFDGKLIDHGQHPKWASSFQAIDVEGGAKGRSRQVSGKFFALILQKFRRFLGYLILLVVA